LNLSLAFSLASLTVDNSKNTNKQARLAGLLNCGRIVISYTIYGMKVEF